MRKYIEKQVSLESAPELKLSSKWSGVTGHLTIVRELKSGNLEETVYTFPVDLSDLFCVASSVGNSIATLEAKLSGVRSAAADGSVEE